MRDFVTIGSTPSDEPCACVGEANYRTRALEECRRFIALLRDTFGPEPEGACLRTRWFPHDFRDYVQVVCYFDSDLPESMDYAFQCEDDAPATWASEEESA